MLESGVSPCEMIYLFVLLWQRYFRDSVQCCGQHLMSQLLNHHYFFAIEQLRSILFEFLVEGVWQCGSLYIRRTVHDFSKTNSS